MKSNKTYLRFFMDITMILTLVTIGLSFENTTVQAQDITVENEYYFPYFLNHSENFPSTSYYLPTADQAFLYNLGCEHGIRDYQAEGIQDSVVVLDFSYPVCNANVGFGADLFEDSSVYGVDTDPVSTAVIGAGVKQFALGYYNCSAADTESNVVIGVGTNNKQKSCDTATKAANHGKAWAEMVSDINLWAVQRGIFHQVQAYGASDIELSWSSPTWSRAWVDGFGQVGGNFMLHFGDAAGCPYDANPHWSCGTTAYDDWTQEDVWYVSWGAPPALPLPLIYLTSGVHAQQWASLSRYSVAQHGYRMDFTGVFTQWQYCQQFPLYQACQVGNNSPDKAFFQLTSELNKYPETAQRLRWQADIRWIFQNEGISSSTSSEGEIAGTQTHPVQVKIEILRDSLGIPDLSPTLQISLDRKLQNYQIFLERIEASKRTPAQKMPMNQSYIDLLQSSTGMPVSKIFAALYDRSDR